LEENVRRSVYRSVGATCRDAGRFVSAVPEVDRFWRKVDRGLGCWVWLGLTTSEGYGRFFVPGGEVRAHRYAYELLVGPIPEDHTLDHLDGCLNPSCVRPDHLEPVTNAENLRRRHARQRLLNGATR